MPIVNGVYRTQSWLDNQERQAKHAKAMAGLQAAKDRRAADRAAAAKAATSKAAGPKIVKDPMPGRGGTVRTRDTTGPQPKLEPYRAATSQEDARQIIEERKRSGTYTGGNVGPDVNVGGSSVFYGTNIPTAGYTSQEIADFNSRLKAEIDIGNTRDANDIIFSIAFARGGGQGNERVGAVQSGMWKLNEGPLWAEQRVNSTNDAHQLRDPRTGRLTGEIVSYSDQHGVVRGVPGQLKPIGSWGGNAKAGIVEGQPTTAPPPASNTAVPIVDLDEGRILSPVISPTGQYDPSGRGIISKNIFDYAGPGPSAGGGLLGGGFYPGGYPVAPMAYPSGASYPAAAEAAEGYAGALGFNIGPEGGLVYRPWEAQAWKQTGIDPNLWNAPFARGGLLGGGVPPGGPITIPEGDETSTTPVNPNPVSVHWPDYDPRDPTQWHPPTSGGFVLDPNNPADPFMQWTQWTHQQNQAANAAKWTDPNAVDQFAFEDYKAGPLSRAVADQARENAFLQQSAIPVTAQGAFGPSADAVAAAQAAAARTPYSYTPPTMAGPVPVPSVYTAPSWAQTGLLPPTTSGFVSDF